MSYRIVLFVTSLLLFSSFTGVVLLVNTLNQQQLEIDLNQDARRLKTAFEILQLELEHEMLSIADLFASDLEVRRLIAEGAAAVQNEGGGRGGAQAALIREALRRRITPQWKTMREEIGLQQIHIQIIPQATSFLRMLAPETFGDALFQKRRLIQDVQNDGQHRSGFEIGPSYAGVRGVVPVWAPGADSTTLVGSLEVGVSFAGHVERLSNQTGVGYGIVLNHKSVVETMLQPYYPPQFPKKTDGNYLLAASRPELADWLIQNKLPTATIEYTQLVNWQKQLFQVIAFPLRDYLGNTDTTRPAIGSVVIWHDVSQLTEASKAFRFQINRLVITGYFAAQILVFWLVRLSRREWQHQLNLRTRELEEKEAKLLQIAITDGLTGLFNRRYFLEQMLRQLAQLQRLNTSCALLMIDIDFFKRVNDTYGHAAGDAVLQRFAIVATQNLRKIDVIGRIGGEEFAVLLPGINKIDTLDAAERLRQMIANETVETEQGLVSITISIGVSELTNNDVGAESALKRADEALYRAKAAGRNRIECNLI